MFDPLLIRVFRHPLDRIGVRLASAGVGANAMTITGFLLGVAGAGAIALGAPLAGLICIVANRVCDGLDGAVARATRATDFGGYLDIVLDFVFYASVVAAFAGATPSNAVAAAVLLTAFMGTGSSFLALAVIAAKRGIDYGAYGRKSFFYSRGLAEGGETFAFFVVVCLWPELFEIAAYVFALMCGLTVLQRIAMAKRLFQDKPLDHRPG
jgi:phosphatidylglycerophosphate synthase